MSAPPICDACALAATAPVRVVGDLAFMSDANAGVEVGKAMRGPPAPDPRGQMAEALIR
jgi:hypothetical protein